MGKFLNIGCGCGPQKGLLFSVSRDCCCLTSKSIKGAALPLESIDNVHSSDSLPLGMFSVGDSISDDILKENLENTTGLFIDESRDTLDSSSAGQTPDGRLGYSLDVVSQHLTMTLSTSLSQPLASFATSSHVCVVVAGESVTDANTRRGPKFKPTCSQSGTR
jgi:hypothetical protein